MLSPSPFFCGRVLPDGGVAMWSTLEKHSEPDSLLASDASFN